MMAAEPGRADSSGSNEGIQTYYNTKIEEHQVLLARDACRVGFI